MKITPDLLKKMRACTTFDMPSDAQIALLDHVDALQQQVNALEAAEKRVAELEESVTLVGHDMDTVRYINGLSENKITQLEAELARRDAAAGEPVGYGVQHRETGKFGSWLKPKSLCSASDDYIAVPLYTAPQPAVLPPKEFVVNMPDVEKWRSPDAVRAQGAYRVLVEKEIKAAGGSIADE
ncbi:hypothetical protein [Erwinia tasmaniensis]|uniref:hypothetical protein n=1 Tax=Erwinia tasmaniensis TaxID=338565 RepID=UPI003A4E4672